MSLSENLKERLLKLVDECPRLKIVVLSRDHSVKGTVTEAVICKIRERYRQRKTADIFFASWTVVI